MKNRIALLCLLATGAALLTPRVVADETKTNAAPMRLTREQWQKLTPEEQEARRKALREQRERYGGTNQPSLREQLMALPPAEREAKLKELRAQQGLPPLDPEVQKRREELLMMSPEEQRAKLAEMRKNRPAAPPVDEKVLAQRRAALLKQLADLRAKKAAGTLTPREEKRLEALEQAEKAIQAHPLPSQPADKAAGKTAEPAGKSN